MTSVKISSQGEQIIVEWNDLNSEFNYSQSLFDSFSRQLNEYISMNDLVYRFISEETVERRILDMLDDLKIQYQDFNIEHDSNINKNIQNYKKSKDDFAKFSEKARFIRNHEHHDSIELDNFENSLTVLKRKLFWHQKLSAYHMAFARNACNFSVPGSGKTTVVYSVYNYLKAANEVNKLIVIGPISSSIAWQEEYKEVFGENPNYLSLRGDTPQARLDSIYGPNSPEIIHLNFESLEKHIEHIRYFNNKHKVMMVVDEAHRIKSIEGYWAKNLLKLVEDIECSPVSRIILTGTPAPNSYEDLYNLFKFIWPRNNIIGFPPKLLRQISIKPDLPSNRRRIDQLINDTSPFYIRVTKATLGLPKVNINEPINCIPDNKQIEIYNYIKDDLIKHISKDKKKGFFGLRLIRLRQAATNPSLLKNPVFIDGIEYSEDESYLDNIKTKIIDYDSNYLSSKFIYTLKLITDLRSKNRKVLIWCEFIDSTHKLASLMDTNNIKYAYLTGEISDIDERKKIIDDFNSLDGELEVIIATPQTVGESISLHKMCHDAIYFEISYNAGLHLQSMDRIHRLGLKEGTETNYWYIQSDFPVERNILERIRQKEKLMRAIIESEEIPLISIFKNLYENPYETINLRDIESLINE